MSKKKKELGHPEAGRKTFRWSAAVRAKKAGQGNPKVLLRVPKPLLRALRGYRRKHYPKASLQRAILEMCSRTVGFDSRTLDGEE